MAVPVRLYRFKRSTASLATTGLTVPIVTAGTKKTRVTMNRTRAGQLSAIVTGPSSSLDSETAFLRIDSPGPPNAAAASQSGWVSSMSTPSVMTDAARKSQLACFSSFTKSAILPPRKLPRLSPASKTPMTLVQP